MNMLLSDYYHIALTLYSAYNFIEKDSLAQMFFCEFCSF